MAVEVVSDTLCIGCNLCVRVCPVDVFRLQGPEKGKKAYIAYQEELPVVLHLRGVLPHRCDLRSAGKPPAHPVALLTEFVGQRRSLETG